MLSRQIHSSQTYLSFDNLKATPPVLFCPNYSTRREVVLRGSLPLGRYIIIPFTAKPDQQGSFLLRVLTEEGNTAKYELTDLY